MISKERINCTLSHKSPDRVAVDFGSTAVTGRHVMCVAKLRDYYGLKNRPVKVYEPYQMLGEIEDDLLEVLGVDTIALPAPSTIFGFRNENWKQFKAPWGQELLVSEHFSVTQDTNGDLLLYPQGDMTAPPSARMPVGGFFFDTIIRQEPVDDDHLRPEDNLEEFQPLSDSDLRHYKVQAKHLASSDRAVVGAIGGTAFGDIALARLYSSAMRSILTESMKTIPTDRWCDCHDYIMGGRHGCHLDYGLEGSLSNHNW